MVGVMLVIAVVIAMNVSKLAAVWDKVRQFYYEVIAEMKKVSWPSKDHVVGSTILVGVATLGLMVMIGFMDKIFGWLVALIFTA